MTDWHAKAARKTSWQASKAVRQLDASCAEDAAVARAWDAPWRQPGHRAALQAWPRLQQQWQAMPQLAHTATDWARQGRLLLLAAERGLWWTADEQGKAWEQALPGAALPQRLTPLSSWVPAGMRSMAQQAVEYFAPVSSR